MDQQKPMSEKCITGCGNTPNFTVQMILSSRGVAPRRQHASKVIGICDNCCNPHSVAYGTLKTLLMVELWMNRNEHTRKLETAPMYSKTAAAGQ